MKGGRDGGKKRGRERGRKEQKRDGEGGGGWEGRRKEYLHEYTLLHTGK